MLAFGAHQPGDGGIRVRAQLEDVFAPSHLNHGVDRIPGGQFLQAARDSGQGGLVADQQQPIPVGGQRAARLRADHPQLVAGLGGVGPVLGKPHPVAGEIDSQFLGGFIEPTYGIGAEQGLNRGVPDHGTVLIELRPGALPGGGVWKDQPHVVVKPRAVEAVDAVRAEIVGPQLRSAEDNAAHAGGNVFHAEHFEFADYNGMHLHIPLMFRHDPTFRSAQ